MSGSAKKRALVTGGTRGIGLAIAHALNSQGVEVWVTGRKAPAQFPFKVLEVEFSERSSVDALISQATALKLDILVNNAGINVIAPFCEIKDQDFDRVLEVNLRSPMALIRGVLPGMVERGYGRIVNLSSVFGTVSKEFRASYSASKFGLVGLTAALSAEVAAHGVLVNCIAPGFVETDLTREVLGPEGMKKMAATVPIQRLAQPSEIAEYVAWISSEKNTYISGQNLVIDGGFVNV